MSNPMADTAGLTNVPTPSAASQHVSSPAVSHALERLRDLNSFIQQSRSGKMLTAEDARQQDEMHRRIGDIIGILQAAATQ